MNDFFNSKLIKDLQAGKLPEVTVGFENSTLVNLGITLAIVAAFSLLLWGIVKKMV